jgi:flagellar biosynthesis protein FliR
MLQAFLRSFEIFPMYATSIPLMELINMDYLIKMTSNVLFIGLQIASPILLATLGQDIILGIISRTAPQVNVFQLSFLFKPVFGAAIMIWILPMLINIITDFFNSHASIF